MLSVCVCVCCVFYVSKTSTLQSECVCVRCGAMTDSTENAPPQSSNPRNSNSSVQIQISQKSQSEYAFSKETNVDSPPKSNACDVKAWPNARDEKG
mmetsp:Transcript_4424/g.6493  ORF Transcript_4424/g.6493 Transcript_4424/m.6493 type:complete len:96 (+) Transcript_4424:80-367(+)